MNVENVVPMAPPREPVDMEVPHKTVLLHEMLAALAPYEGGTYVDATLGAGGHAEAILSVAGTRVIGIDRDLSALAIARGRLGHFGDRFVPVHGKFSEIAGHLEALGISCVHGICADIGVSSMQLNEAERGMSFRLGGPIDMRMDASDGSTALDLIEALSDDELADVLFRFGDEKRSRRVARCIKQAHAAGELHTTLDLRRAVIRAVGPARIGGVDPATKTFQALRIAVNDELGELNALIEAAKQVLSVGSVFAVISFHSLEDRLMKRAFRSVGWSALTKKPVVPSDAETAENPRARSAKLRAARRIDESENLGFDMDDPDTFGGGESAVDDEESVA
ncbi:MAG: 16S rRNA (cytosine(1402)-N(4))-methyltransferase RsmH [Polyangiaceae bacterium]|nr:16S rRNA (cytosine(1402)-N(4))-methyltransferase RsmH [Polyangiaceae bacterium]